MPPVNEGETNETNENSQVEQSYPQISSDQVLLGQGLVEVYDAFNDCMRQVPIDRAKKLAEKDESLKQRLISLGVNFE